MPIDRALIPPSLRPLIESEDLDQILEQRHPEYTERRGDWEVLTDGYQGGGGFRDGSYLFAFPRESQADYQRRMAAARYHNYIGPIIDLTVRLLFTQSVRRTSNNPTYNDWLQDVDGTGKDVNSVLKHLVQLALTSGHAGVLVDMTSEEPTGPSKADQRARVILRPFGATTIADWSFDGPQLSSVKLIEPTPRRSITRVASSDAPDCHYLLWTEDGWIRLDDGGVLLAAGVPNLGLVPFVVLRSSPTVLSSMTGRPLVGNPNIVRALYNRASEEDQVLRDQAFSVMTVSVGPDGNVDQARAQLGQTIGTATALVVQGQIQYQTPDQSVPGTIRANISYLVQELYRAAHMRYSHGSGMVESGESIRLQHTELNEMLQGLARSLRDAERQIARAWFAWTYPTPESAERAYQDAEPEASYPDQFIDDDLSRDLDAWSEAMRMGLGPTMTRRIKKRTVRRVDPDIPAAELQMIDDEIDAQPTSEDLPPFPLDRGDPEGEDLRRAAPDE